MRRKRNWWKDNLIEIAMILAMVMVVLGLLFFYEPAPAPYCPPGQAWEWDDGECEDYLDALDLDKPRKPVKPKPTPKPTKPRK